MASKPLTSKIESLELIELQRCPNKHWSTHKYRTVPHLHPESHATVRLLIGIDYEVYFKSCVRFELYHTLMHL